MLRRTLRSVPFVLAVAALVLAGSADAGGHKWKHHKRHHGHHHQHHHGCGHGGYYAPRYVEHRHYSHPVYPVYHYAQPPEAYYCGPCSNRFDSYDDLSYHVHRHHHVAVFELPSVIFQTSIGGGVGWVFGH